MTPTYELLAHRCDFQLGNAGTAKDFQACGQLVTQMPQGLGNVPGTWAIMAAGEGFASAPRSSIVHCQEGFTAMAGTPLRHAAGRGVWPQQSVSAWQRGLPGGVRG